MDLGSPLKDYLSRRAASAPHAESVAMVIERLADVAADIADVIAQGGLDGDLGQTLGQGAGGDLQKALDLKAHAMFRDALESSAVAAFASEEADEVEFLNRDGSLCVAIDPVDGSGNLNVNMAVGTIFSVLPMPERGGTVTQSPSQFRWPAGTAQLAAGFFVYGPQTALMLSTGESVDLFTLDRNTRTFRLTRETLRMPAVSPHEYAINASNYRHWEEPVRAFVDECLTGASGPAGRDFNMRWHGALVAEAYRILLRGGIYLYPGDAREGYREGRLRLIYEGYPMAFLMERVGGSASDLRRRILDIEAQTLHQRVPLIMGSSDMVEHLQSMHHRPGLWPPAPAPLFASRGLFRS